MGNGQHGFLNGAHGNPTQQVEFGTSLIIGATSTSTTKWLLTNNGTCALIVNVNITSTVAKHVEGIVNDKAITSKAIDMNKNSSTYMAPVKPYLVLVSTNFNTCS